MIYSIQNDTLNGLADTYALQKEVSTSNIAVALNSITTSGDVLTFDFKAALSGAEQTELDALVAAHSGAKIVEPNVVQLETQTPLGVPEVAMVKADGESDSFASHDFCKKTTWFSTSERVTDETLSNAGLVYFGANDFWIDLVNGHVAKEDSFSSPYLAKIYVDDVEVTSGFSINYEDGEVTFESDPGGVVKADYSYAVSSHWVLEPEAGKMLQMEHAELDFTVDVEMRKTYFEVWVYNPLFDGGQAPTSAPAYGWQPGDAGNPLRFIYQRVTYKNYKDILKIANDVSTIEPLFGITNRTLRAVFDYGRSIDLKSSMGMQLRISIADNVPFVGEWGSITLYCLPKAEL